MGLAFEIAMGIILAPILLFSICFTAFLVVATIVEILTWIYESVVSIGGLLK